MENHGVVVVGATMTEAYKKFEALEFCARAQVRAQVLNKSNIMGSLEHLLAEDDMVAQHRSSGI
jgi:L-fuculose-phosphate aldolase